MYEKRIIFFIDILGFRNIVEKTGKDKDYCLEIFNVLNSMRSENINAEMFLEINETEESKKEMDFFNEALSLAINPDVAKENGYVWLVREAKKREGSAVVWGSNPITPTLYIKNYEPQKSTYKSEPVDTTQLTNKFIFNPNIH